MKVGNLKRITKPVKYLDQLRSMAVNESRYCPNTACPMNNLAAMCSRLRIYEGIDFTIEVVTSGAIITRIK